MPYDILQKNYETLTDEQQIIVNNLILFLANLNTKTIKSCLLKNVHLEIFEGKAKAVFSDSWEMTEEKL